MPDEYRQYLDLLLDHPGGCDGDCPECRMLRILTVAMDALLNADAYYPVQIWRRAQAAG